MKKSSPSCQCSYLNDRIKKQEEAIAQLVEIIGTTNRRLYELDQRHHFLTQPNGKANPTPLQTST
ncbi:hypothetical protein [Halobacillus mangrovi]|uniref:Uncharacterized protein n=1 Tax=Halobacillus mangrovi TaxID=402384 RepID=A0A1W5ZT87_9BACI|nr:hypothetical protein [Halobacillus mangrovi]ARI76526.1 hypothetical protein HM131_06620 [Halobacillus mangrovi]